MLLADEALTYQYGDDFEDTADDEGFIILEDEIVFYWLENIDDMYYIYEYKVQ